MNHPVLSAFGPVVVLIALGWWLGRRQWVPAHWTPHLSRVAFVVLSPLLLFRAMANVHLEQLDARPVVAYFTGLGVVFAATLVWQGLSRRSAVLALASTYSNLVMIGIPLVSLTWGEPGLVVLLTIIALHALLLLVSATLVLELARAREHADPGGQGHSIWGTVTQALRGAVIHPVPLPILLGLAYAQTGWAVPAAIDAPMRWAGQLYAPLALLLVGLTLAETRVGAQLRAAMQLVLVKNAILPLVVLALGVALGVTGLPLSIMLVASALPIGANVFLFSQRYEVARDEVTAGVALSTLVALFTVSMLIAWRAG